jgi:hypothetical protein
VFYGGFDRVSSFMHMMVLHGNLKSQEQLLEMEEIGKVPVSGQVFDFLNNLAVPVYRKLFRIREPPVPVTSKMGSFHESKG